MKLSISQLEYFVYICKYVVKIVHKYKKFIKQKHVY